MKNLLVIMLFVGFMGYMSVLMAKVVAQMGELAVVSQEMQEDLWR